MRNKLTVAALTATRRAGRCFILCAVLCTALCTSCLHQETQNPGTVFIHENTVYQAHSGIPLFTVTDTVRQRSLCVTARGILMWNGKRQHLEERTATGALISSMPLEAEAVFVSPDSILARGKHFAEPDGFRFSLYRYTGASLQLLWEGNLDCFPSDLVFRSDGTALLAGGNRSDSELRLFELSETAGARILFSTAKDDSFLRIVDTPQGLLLFRSSREKTQKDLSIFLEDREGVHGFKEYTIYLPEGLCWFGYGFLHGGNSVLPLATDRGDIALAVLSTLAGEPVVQDLVPDSGGVFYPLGTTATDPAHYLYLAHDPIQNPGHFGIGIFDGRKCVQIPLGSAR